MQQAGEDDEHAQHQAEPRDALLSEELEGHLAVEYPPHNGDDRLQQQVQRDVVDALVSPLAHRLSGVVKQAGQIEEQRHMEGVYEQEQAPERTGLSGEFFDKMTDYDQYYQEELAVIIISNALLLYHGYLPTAGPSIRRALIRAPQSAC